MFAENAILKKDMINIVKCIKFVTHVILDVYWDITITIEIKNHQKRIITIINKENLNELKKNRRSKISDLENQLNTLTELIKSTISVS